MKRMKTILYFVVTLLEAGLLAGAYVVNYFTVKKLGMIRWVNFTSLKWENMYPIFQIKLITILLLAVLSVLVFCLYLKRKKSVKKFTGIMATVMCMMSGISICYMLFSSFESMRAYYLICMMLAAAAALQIIKTLAGIMVCRNEE